MPKALNSKQKTNRLAVARLSGGLCLVALSASCVPVGTAPQPIAAIVLSSPQFESELPPLALPAPESVMAPALPVEKAVALNEAIPVSDAHNPAARAFILRTRSFSDKMRSLECLTSAIYYEAASESDDGQRAVAQVVLNRVRHPTYPNSVCGVVFQGSERTTGCQFSFTCDGSMARTPSIAGWARARRIAEAALSGSVYAPVGLATHYHTFRVHPYWASSLVKSAVIGAHIFYRWSGGWGTPAAFRQTYAGVEPMPAPRRLDASPLTPAQEVLTAELSALIDTRQAAPEYLPAASAPVSARLPIEPEITGGPDLPDSQVRDKYRYSGLPRDQLPAGAK